MSTFLKSSGRIAGMAFMVAALALACVGVAVAPAATQPRQTATDRLARHFDHEDALYEVNYTTAAGRSPAEAIALHLKHEDALFQTRRSASASSSLLTAAIASDGFDWNDALVGAGSAVGVLLLSAAAVVVIRRGRSNSSRLVKS